MFIFKYPKTQPTISIKRLWLLVTVFTIAGVFIAFLGVEKTAAQASVHFSDCGTVITGYNAIIGIPSYAPQVHIPGGVFTPETGDEFAVFRPVDGACSRSPSLCAGSVDWVEDMNAALTVWGDDDLTPEIEGMDSAEEMCWRVWDSSADNEYLATVTYEIDPSGNGTYLTQGIYVVASLTPTAIDLTGFSAKSDPGGLFSGLVVLGLVLIAGFALYITRQRIIS